jgi:hypothetical protein
MSERQEKVWVVTRARLFDDGQLGIGSPVKAFDDRKDARKYAKDIGCRAKRFRYFVDGVKKG